MPKKAPKPLRKLGVLIDGNIARSFVAAYLRAHPEKIGVLEDMLHHERVEFIMLVLINKWHDYVDQQTLRNK